ncbi:hypothetical protein K438DRAFT_1764867 [Mycena galopus ATCC 62051]|nr:hypothetical protein K438DRAFT_1764867 [Mycena galopus ATCC 62051]
MFGTHGDMSELVAKIENCPKQQFSRSRLRYRHWLQSHHRTPPDTGPRGTISRILGTDLPLDRLAVLLDWDQFFATLTPAWLPGFSFPPGSFNAAATEQGVLMTSYIEFDAKERDLLAAAWLSQANVYITPSISDGEHRSGHPEGTMQEVHLAVSPVRVKYQDFRAGVEYPQSDHFYWSSDAAGTAPLSSEECDSIGIPRLKFAFFCGASYWYPYHYGAVREFFHSKGFDPYSYDVTRLLGFPMADMLTSATYERYLRWVGKEPVPGYTPPKVVDVPNLLKRVRNLDGARHRTLLKLEKYRRVKSVYEGFGFIPVQGVEL